MVLAGALLLGAASCNDFGGSTPYYEEYPESGGSGGSGGVGGGAGTAGAAGQAGTAAHPGNVPEECGLAVQPARVGPSSVDYPSCLELADTNLISVVHAIDENCDGAAEHCYRMDEAMLPSGVMVPYAHYDECGCDLTATALLACNRSGTFVKSRWDTDQDGVADRDCSLEVYDEKARLIYESVDRHCSGVPEKCANYEYDSMGRQQMIPCNSGSFYCNGYRDESEWRPAEWGTDINCDGRLDEDCTRSSFFFPFKKLIDQDCDGKPESGCEHFIFDGRGCPTEVESISMCDGVLDGCVLVVGSNDDCSWLSVAEDSDCNGVPDGYPCRYLDTRGPRDDTPLDQDCDGVMDLRCRIRHYEPGWNAFWEGADDDCNGIIDTKCEAWHWSQVQAR